jgi:CheY-like chemotaxis protein
MALPAGSVFHAGRGCRACGDSGFSGRTGCYEVLKVSKGIARLIEQRAADTALRALAEDEGMTSLVEDAREKVLAGITTPAEVLRVVEVEQRGPTCPSCHNGIEGNFTVCPYCKNPLRIVCTGCNAVMKKKWTTCPFCGTDVAPPARPASLLPEPTKAEPALGGFDVPRILAVDDDDDVLEVLRLTLTRGKMRFEVEIAHSGEEALAKVKEWQPHLVLLDLMMPGMDGFEVCKRLRADLSTALIPVLMLTALGDSDSKRMAFLSGTDDYVVKPFERLELLARLQRLLERNYGWTGARPADDPTTSSVSGNA